LFSGGLDSTAVAVQFLQEGVGVNMLTFYNGAQKWLDLAQTKATHIIKSFPGLTSWEVRDCTFLFHELAIRTIETDIKTSGNLVCCACKLAMLTEAILYCKQAGISRIADGFKKAQVYYPEQTPEYMDATSRFALEYQVDYVHPIWDRANVDLEDIALSGNVPTSPMQPYCLFERNRVTDRSFISAFVEAKIALARTYLQDRIGRPTDGKGE
jgi:7-cyano-7-deazaguanine synthase in queuosine biosynthesis